MDAFAPGKLLHPDAARRVRERSRKLTVQTRQRLGVLDVAVELVREAGDAE